MSRYIDAEKLKENFIGVYEDEINFSFDGYAIKCIDEAPSIGIDLADDGTLSVSVDDATKVTRVLVEDGENGDLYYADRPQGEWKPFDLTWGRSIYACSVCEEAIAVPCGWSDGKPIYDYCPMCGAKMKGTDNE